MEDKTINKRYKFSSKNILGRGSFGIVYQGVDLLTGELVAVKVIN